MAGKRKRRSSVSDQNNLGDDGYQQFYQDYFLSTTFYKILEIRHSRNPTFLNRSLQYLDSVKKKRDRFVQGEDLYGLYVNNRKSFKQHNLEKSLVVLAESVSFDQNFLASLAETHAGIVPDSGHLLELDISLSNGQGSSLASTCTTATLCECQTSRSTVTSTSSASAGVASATASTQAPGTSTVPSAAVASAADNQSSVTMVSFGLAPASPALLDIKATERGTNRIAPTEPGGSRETALTPDDMDDFSTSTAGGNGSAIGGGSSAVQTSGTAGQQNTGKMAQQQQQQQGVTARSPAFFSSLPQAALPFDFFGLSPAKFDMLAMFNVSIALPKGQAGGQGGGLQVGTAGTSLQVTGSLPLCVNRENSSIGSQGLKRRRQRVFIRASQHRVKLSCAGVEVGSVLLHVGWHYNRSCFPTAAAAAAAAAAESIGGRFSQVQKVGRYVRSRPAKIPVYFKYLFANEARYQAERRMGFGCPWCTIKCQGPTGLISHLVRTHVHFTFKWEVAHSNTLIISVALHPSANQTLPAMCGLPAQTSPDRSGGRAAHGEEVEEGDKEGNDKEGKDKEGKDKDTPFHPFGFSRGRNLRNRLRKLVAKSLDPTRVQLGDKEDYPQLSSSVAVSKRKKAQQAVIGPLAPIGTGVAPWKKAKLNKLEEDQGRESYWAASLLAQRTFFHSSTLKPMEIHELLYDSDALCDDEWVTNQSERYIEEFDDVVWSEKRFMTLWNRFVHSNNFYCDAVIPRRCVQFAKVYGSHVSRCALRTTLLLHLLNMWQWNLLTVENIAECMAEVDKHNGDIELPTLELEALLQAERDEQAMQQARLKKLQSLPGCWNSTSTSSSQTADSLEGSVEGEA